MLLLLYDILSIWWANHDIEGYAGRLNTPKTLQRLQLTKLRVGHALNSAGIALQLVFVWLFDDSILLCFKFDIFKLNVAGQNMMHEGFIIDVLELFSYKI